MRTVTVFAPASIGNVCVGFDTLGLALPGLGDRCRVRVRDPRSSVSIVDFETVTGQPGTEPLPEASQSNAAVIAASAVLERVGGGHVEMSLHKGLPTGSGLGSSSASAVAAAQATNLALGNPLRPLQVLGCCLEAEAAVSGRHADNIAPSLLGGLVLVRRLDPLDVVRLPVPEGLTVVLIRPELSLLTSAGRGVIPESMAMEDSVAHSANLGSFVAACYSGDLDLMSRCVVDPIAEPVRIGMIKGGAEALAAMRAAGAIAASISGSGPALFALCRSKASAADVADAGVAAMQSAGVEAKHIVAPADSPGAREV